MLNAAGGMFTTIVQGAGTPNTEFGHPVITAFCKSDSNINDISPLLKGVEEESYKSLKECVKDLAGKEKDITILLSPACTSFDEFKSYEDRGYKFKDYILEYTNGGK